MEPVPRRKIEYKGIILEEMDLDAVFARQPTIALVDELAHTNAPGAAMQTLPRRRRTVLAGIGVITTLNMQHLESLHDIVERAAGVRVKERLLDYVVTMADQIVNVDLCGKTFASGCEPERFIPASESRRPWTTSSLPEN